MPGDRTTRTIAVVDVAAARRKSRARRRAPWLKVRASLVLMSLPLVVFLALPVITVILRAPPTLFLRHLGDAAVIKAMWLSCTTTITTTIVTILAGTPLAYLLARHRFRGRSLVETLVEAPMVLPPAVAGLGLLLAFGRRGLVGGPLSTLGLNIAFTEVAVILAQLFVAAPFYVKAAIGGFSGVDREVEQAAALDGASGWQIFHMVTAPLAWPALFGGVVMTWARALGEFGATLIFAGNLPGRTQTMPLAIYLGFELDLSVALTLAVILLVISFAILLLVKGALRSRMLVS